MKDLRWTTEKKVGGCIEKGYQKMKDPEKYLSPKEVSRHKNMILIGKPEVEKTEKPKKPKKAK